MLSFLESLFCGKHKSEIERLRAERETFLLTITDLEKKLRDKELLIEAHKMENNRLRDERTLLESKIATLEKWLDESIRIPNIENYVIKEELVMYAPWEHTELWEYQMSTADLAYFALPQERWDIILPRIQKVVEKTLKTWEPENRDCDDWALAMQSFVMIAFTRLWPRIYLQGAFLTTWSMTHAYNAYVTPDDIIHIYEPQTGETISVLEDAEAPYDAVKIWFPGTKRL